VDQRLDAQAEAPNEPVAQRLHVGAAEADHVRLARPGLEFLEVLHDCLCAGSPALRGVVALQALFEARPLRVRRIRDVHDDLLQCSAQRANDVGVVAEEAALAEHDVLLHGTPGS
jgi:hypothetical protein